VGITGHRDLRKEDEEPLREKVREIFSELRETYPFTPLRLLSGLAEGADRLAAYVALANTVELVACLPMKRSLYESDFVTDASRSEFQELLKSCSQVIHLPLAEGNTAENVREQGPQRDKQYRSLGTFLAEHSQILIALWDGTRTELVGGTSWVVQLQLGEHCDCNTVESASALDFPETGPVYQIIAPREKNTETIGKPFERHDRYHGGFESKEAAKKAYARIFERMDLFNRDVLTRIERGHEASHSGHRLIPKPIRVALPNELQRLIDHYAVADALAIFFQRRTRQSMRILIFGYGLVGLIWFAIFAHGPPKLQLPALLLYLLTIALASGHYWYAKSNELKTRYIDYRALAEGLRVQTFWTLAGINHTVANHYLRKQKTELDWIRNAVRAWSLKLQGVHVVRDLEAVQKHWVEDQARFFDKASRRDSKHHRRELRWTWSPILGLAITGLAAAIGYASLETPFPLFPRLTTHEYEMDVHGAVAIIMTLLPAISGVVAAYSLKMAFNEQRKQYSRMRELYQHGSKCLAEALSSKNERQARAQRIILDLGKEALEENGDWVLLHREREFEMRVGG